MSPCARNMSPDAMPTNLPPMDEEVKRGWVHSLQNSGHEKKTGQLVDMNTPFPESAKFSALGILCLRYLMRVGGQFRDGGFEDAAGNFSRSGLPADVLQWAGLEKRGPGVRISSADSKWTIVALNDGLELYDRQSFSFIAEMIEDHL